MMRNDISFKPIRLPRLNNLFGVEDDIDFKFVYYNPNAKYENAFVYSGLFRIKNNKLYNSDNFPFIQSYLSINDLMNDYFIGINILK
jgi:hypothetical protein